MHARVAQTLGPTMVQVVFESGVLCNPADGFGPALEAGSFDPSAVAQVTVQTLTNGSGPAVDSVVHIDSVTFSVGAPGPYLFTTDSSPLSLNTHVAGATVTWIP